MDKKKKIRIIAIAIACAIAVIAAIVIPISVSQCNRETPPATQPGGNTPGGDKPDDGDKDPDNPKPPVPPVEPPREADWDYLSELIDLSEIDQEATPYCATDFTGKAYVNGEFTEQSCDYYIVGAYVEDQPTRLYVYGNGHSIGYVTASYYSNGLKYFTGRTGGIATNGLSVWLASESRVYCLTYWQHTGYTGVNDLIIERAASHGEITITNTFDPNCRADFIYYRENPDGQNDLEKYQLFVGETHGEHEIDSTHKITFKDSEGKDVVTNAYVVQYTAYVSDTPNIAVTTGLRQISDSEKTPAVKRIFALGDNVTGFAATKDDLILTDGEKLFYYDWKKIDASGNSNSFKSLKGADFQANTMTGSTVTIEGVNVFYIKPEYLIKNYEPETAVKDLLTIGDKFYVM